jgi:hypothetical protein
MTSATAVVLAVLQCPSRLLSTHECTGGWFDADDYYAPRAWWLARFDGGAEPRDGPELQVPNSLGAAAKKMPRRRVCGPPAVPPARAVATPREAPERRRQRGLDWDAQKGAQAGASRAVRERDGAQRAAGPVRAERVDDADRAEWGGGRGQRRDSKHP